MKRLWIAIQDELDSFVAHVLVLERIVTIHTVAVVTERAHGETVTVELKTH